ncbi:hypothetical protein VTL71DRAFT_3993 [Oculimacula yallundae]|uniref:Beta-lactamase-related domain-containing protein n=1 Tax=Oculimacula yallundae TaxID=86028 RepID=A0ABR4C6X7_9HELO
MVEASRFIRDGSLTPEFNDLVSQTMKRWKAPGLSLAVINNDAFTSKSLSDKPVTLKTLFNAANMTKAFTAIAVSFLVDDDEMFPEVLKETPVANLIGDDFVLPDSRINQVTVEDILSHRTGLPERGNTEDMATPYRYDLEKKEHFTVPWLAPSEGSGAGENISNVLDYAEFLKCMINESGPTSENGHEELTKPRAIIDDDLKPFMSHTCYALGYELQEKLCWSLFYDLPKVPIEKQFDWDGNYQERQDRDNPKIKEELYPDLPEKPLPTTLDLSAYVGEYHHPGYLTHVVELKDGELEMNGLDRICHIS